MSILRQYYTLRQLKLVLQILVFCLSGAILISCNQIEQKNKPVPDKRINQNKAQLTLVDYKSSTLKISIGENYKTTSDVIDWQWARLADPDNKIDSTGIDEFFCLGESLTEYNNGKWIPALHIKTNKNLITSFTCNIVFILEGKANSVEEFLQLLSKDIEQLKNSEIAQSLKDNGFYEKIRDDCTETFKLTKANEWENGKFQYTIKAKQQKEL